MIYYATATSERATKSQGGNKKLSVILTVGMVEVLRACVEPHSTLKDTHTLVVINGDGSVLERKVLTTK